MIPSAEERSKVIDDIAGALRAEPRYAHKAGVKYGTSFPYCTIEIALDEELPAVCIADHTGVQGLGDVAVRLLYRGDADGLLCVDLEEPYGPSPAGEFAGSTSRLLRSHDGKDAWALTAEDRSRFDAFLLYAQRQLRQG